MSPAGRTRRIAINAVLVGLSAAACARADATDTAGEPAVPGTAAPTSTLPPTAATSPPAVVTVPMARGSPTSTEVTIPPAPVAVRSGADRSLDANVGDPLAIVIPDIDVWSELVPAGVLEDGSIAVPDDPSIAGWFTGGPRPGDRGPAVIVGHVDSKRGPGVFWGLRDLAVGARVIVDTTTGPLEFMVESVEQYAKDAFPTERVYGAVPYAALRLITCGGSFDRSIGHYRDNIVVSLTRVRG